MSVKRRRYMAWKLICERGRQVWKYIIDDLSNPIQFDLNNPNSQDEIFRQNAFQSISYTQLCI